MLNQFSRTQLLLGPEAMAHLSGCRVAVFARPWNADTELPSPLFRRCEGWGGVGEFFDS